jgi:outer membrane protein
MKYIILSLVLLSFSFTYAQNEIINNYIKLGIDNNLALKQKDFSLQQSIADLDEARGMFLPSIDFKARYTRADGGRDIEILVGDLVNPMQNALNGINPNFNFPANIQNEIIPFLRKEEQETKVSLVQPIIQPALFYNYSIKSSLVDIQTFKKKIYARKLISDIKTGYLSVLKTIKIIQLYENTLLLMHENLRVNESLFRNDKITVDHVYRAKSEKLGIEQKLLEANNNHDLAKSYFNFLINQPLDNELEIDENVTYVNEDIKLEELEIIALKNREELNQLKSLLDIAEKTTGAVKSSYYPGLFLAVDYGFQGEKYKFNSDDDYWMASLVLNWNLFNGMKDKAKAEKAEIEAKKNMVQLQELQNKIRLQIRETHKNLIVSQRIIETVTQQLFSSEKSFNIIKKKYAEGLTSQIEYLDAQNQLIQSQISKILAEYSFMENYVKLEKVSALIDLKKYN